MNRPRLIAYLVIAALLALTSALLRWAGPAILGPDPFPAGALPDVIAGYPGITPLFCQNEQCRRSYAPETDRDAPDRCEACGGALDPVSASERAVLPPDTRFLKKLYRGTTGEEYYVTIVISGRERRSVHKPQVCLVAQGHAIIREREYGVSATGDFRMMALDLMRKGPNGGVRRSAYYYWFVVGNRATPRYLEATLLWLRDALLHNRRQPWAYVAIATEATIPGSRADQRTAEFLRALSDALEAGRLKPADVSSSRSR